MIALIAVPGTPNFRGLITTYVPTANSARVVPRALVLEDGRPLNYYFLLISFNRFAVGAQVSRQPPLPSSLHALSLNVLVIVRSLISEILLGLILVVLFVLGHGTHPVPVFLVMLVFVVPSLPDLSVNGSTISGFSVSYHIYNGIDPVTLVKLFVAVRTEETNGISDPYGRRIFQ